MINAPVKSILPILLVALAAPAGAQPQTPGAVFTQYCVPCHNANAKVGGLVINPADLSNVGANPELWEKVVRKLRSSAMPPVNAPRPDQATYESVATFLETELDRAAVAKPNPGKLPLLHRLSRTEYQNAVRDLLALGALPQEMDFSTLLPQDNISSGFDNIADLLFVSPTTMERYLDAARKISRIAVGDPGMPPMVNIHRLSPEHWQDARVDELPFGTRGGIAVRSTFPVDGDYSIKLEVAGAGREAHQLEITVDGERLHVITIGGAAPGGAPGPGSAAPTLEFRIPVKAGVRLVGITFVEQNQARDEETLKPRMRARGTKPALVSAIISGPYDVAGPGDSPSRRRIFVCKPANASAESRLREADPVDAGAARVSAAGDRCRGRAPAAVLHRGPGGRRIRSRDSKSARTVAGESAVPVPHRAGSGECRVGDGLSRERSGAGLAFVVFPVEQHSRR